MYNLQEDLYFSFFSIFRFQRSCKFSHLVCYLIWIFFYIYCVEIAWNKSMIAFSTLNSNQTRSSRIIDVACFMNILFCYFVKPKVLPWGTVVLIMESPIVKILRTINSFSPLGSTGCCSFKCSTNSINLTFTMRSSIISSDIVTLGQYNSHGFKRFLDGFVGRLQYFLNGTWKLNQFYPLASFSGRKNHATKLKNCLNWVGTLGRHDHHFWCKNHRLARSLITHLGFFSCRFSIIWLSTLYFTYFF